MRTVPMIGDDISRVCPILGAWIALPLIFIGIGIQKIIDIKRHLNHQKTQNISSRIFAEFGGAMLSCAGRSESIEAPQVAREILLTCLRAAEARLTQLQLKAISNGHAVYERTFRYQYFPERKARYRDTTRISLSDPMFHRTDSVTPVHPRAAGDWIQFSLE